MRNRIKPKKVFKSIEDKNLIRKLRKMHLKLLIKSNHFKGEEL
jgi:hypothetical protein